MRHVLASIVFSALATTAAAQEADTDAPSPGYRGVVPGRAEQPSHVRGTPGARPTLVTWPGFQPNADGSSRFFFQMTSAPRWEIRRSAGTLTLVLKDVGIGERNSTYPLDTRFFATPVTRATTRRAGRDVHVVFEMRASVEPDIRAEAGPNGYTFLYVSFAAGDYGVAPRPAPTPPPPPPQPPTPVSPNHVTPRNQARPTWGSQPAERPSGITPAQQRALEEERPPGQ